MNLQEWCKERDSLPPPRILIQRHDFLYKTPAFASANGSFDHVSARLPIPTPVPQGSKIRCWQLVKMAARGLEFWSRKFQQTPETYPSQIWKDFLQKQLIEGLGYVRVFLKNFTLQDQLTQQAGKWTVNEDSYCLQEKKDFPASHVSLPEGYLHWCNLSDCLKSTWNLMMLEEHFCVYFPLKNIDRNSFQMANLLVSWDFPLPQLLRCFCLVVERKIRYGIKNIPPKLRIRCSIKQKKSPLKQIQDDGGYNKKV